MKLNKTKLGISLRNSKKAQVFKEIIIAIIVLIILGVMIYILFGPTFKQAVSSIFNKTEKVTEKAVEGIGEIISKFSIKILK